MNLGISLRYIQDVVADLCKVGEQFGVKDAGFFCTRQLKSPKSSVLPSFSSVYESKIKKWLKNDRKKRLKATSRIDENGNLVYDGMVYIKFKRRSLFMDDADSNTTNTRMEETK